MEPPDYFELAWDDELHQTVMFEGQPIVQLTIPMFDDEGVTATIIMPDRTHQSYYIPRANPPKKYEVVLPNGTTAVDIYGDKGMLVNGMWYPEGASWPYDEFVPYKIIPVSEFSNQTGEEEF